jgi:hypothetical protein
VGPFNEEHVQVVRIGVDDGRRFLGRQIAGKDLADTLNRLNVQSATAKMTGSQIVKAVMEGSTVSMSNGWTLKKVRVSNDDRIEIDLGGKYLTTQAANQITESGGVYERIGWSARYFIPTNEKRGGEALDGIMKKTGSNAVAVKGGEDEAPPPAFSRGQEAAPQGGFSASGLPKNRVRSIIDAIRARWKNAPEVVILDSMSEAPDAVRAENERQLSKGATGEPEGFVYGGKVYIVASQMKTPGDVVRVLLHESLGHYGLRGLFGQELHRILKQVAALRRADVEAKARQYGLDMEKESDRLTAAEEVLAEMAQTNPKSGFVQRAIAAIRKWLRENIPGFEDMKLTDGEIIERYLVPAREFVQQGRTAAAPGGLAGAFSRRKDTRTAIANRLLAGLAQSMRVAPSQAAAAAEARKLASPPKVQFTNLSTGMKASVSKKSVKKMMDDSAVWKSASLGAHFAAIANVDKLFEVAIRHGQRPGNRQEDEENIKAVHKFDAPMPFNGEIWRVRMTVKEFVRTDPDGDRIYTLEIADVETPVHTGQPSLQVSHVHEQSTHWRNARFAQMVQIVKDGLKPDDAANSDVRFPFGCSCGRNPCDSCDTCDPAHQGTHGEGHRHPDL